MNNINEIINVLRQNGYDNNQIAESILNLYVTNGISFYDCVKLLEEIDLAFPDEIFDMSEEEKIEAVLEMLGQ